MALRSRDTIAFFILTILIAIIFGLSGAPYTLRMLTEAACYALLALGLTIQWGYAGLFNVGVLGFVAVGAFVTVFLSFPVNDLFWSSEAANMLGDVLLKLVSGIFLIFGASQLHRLGVAKWLRLIITVIVTITVYLWVSLAFGPTADMIEQEAGFIGGLGLPVLIGWFGSALAAGIVAYAIGRICLGLPADYLAIATIGIAEIIKIFLKNTDWLTKGTLTVSPLPWPVPSPADVGFIAARSAYLSLVALLIGIIYYLLQRAYYAPWGRMMRAIRDNHRAAEAMGKNVGGRQLEIFVLGCAIMGLGGAALVTFSGVFDPASFLPLNHTFLVWVMIILGGAGNNRGAIFGAIFVYIIWVMSDPLALWFFSYIENWGRSIFNWEPPVDFSARALQMRVFVIGLTITLVLRFAPQGILPEQLSYIKDEEN